MLKLFLALSALLFQLPTPQSPPSSNRDPEGAAILAKMQAVSGWGGPNSPQDAVATGIVTRYTGDSQDTVGAAFKFKGYTEARVDVSGPSSTLSMSMSGERAAVSGQNGTRSIPARSTLSPSMALPFFCSVLNVSDPNISFRFTGAETVGSQTASRIEIDFSPPDSDTRPKIQRAWHASLWVSTTTSLPLQIQYARIGTDNPTAMFLATRVYSDYRTVNGIAVPFHQEEFVGDRHLSTLQLNVVTFNAGLADADFVMQVPVQ